MNSLSHVQTNASSKSSQHGWISRPLMKMFMMAVLYLGICNHLHATLLVSENFTYPIGSNIAGQNGGMGFSSAWVRHYSGNADGIVVPNLTFSDFPMTGNAVKFSAVSPGNNGASDSRPFSANFGAAPQTVWMSYVCSYTVTPGTSPAYYAAVTTQNNSYPDDSRFSLGPVCLNNTFLGNYETPGGALGATTSQSVTYLIVGKYVGGVGLTMWALTTTQYDAIKSGGVTEAELNANNVSKTFDSFATGDANALQSRLLIYSATFGTSSTLNFTVAAIRMGTTVTDVVPVTLVSENFNYTIGASLVGQNGGTGFSGPWTRHYNANADGTIVPALEFSDYPVTGNAVSLIANSPGANGASDSRPFSANFGAAPQTVWESFLFSYSVIPGSGSAFYAGISTQNNSYPDETRFGLAGVCGNNTFLANYQSPGGTSCPKPNSQPTTYLIIGKYVGGTSMTMWVLTTAEYDAIKAGGITEAALNTTNYTLVTDNFAAGDANTLQARMQLYSATFGSGSTLPAVICSVKMGTTLDSVAMAGGCPTETIGGGTIASPATGPVPAYGIGGAGFTLVKNWHFGTNGTIKSSADLSTNFQYHDQFGTIKNKNYGALIVAETPATALGGQPVAGSSTEPNPIRIFAANSLRTLIAPLNGATVLDPAALNTGSGSFQSIWTAPAGGSNLGQDLIWETRVRYVTPPYFWFALWTSGNQWNSGAEEDLIESFGYNNGFYNGLPNTNYDGHNWHSNSVGGTDATPDGNWGANMALYGIYNYDATQYHTWTWLYKKDNTFIAYVDGVPVQSGTLTWTLGGTVGGTPINMSFIFDGTWGSTTVGNNDGTIPVSALSGTYYDWAYSRVYLR